MACCGNSTNPAQPQPQEAGQSSSSIIHRRTRKWVSLYQALIDGQPDGGWRFRGTLRGIPFEVVGTSPMEAMLRARDYHSLNKEPFDERLFWINANIQWIEKTDVKNHLVSVSDLVATLAGAGAVPGTAPVATHPPSEWGSTAWKFLGLILARDRYDVMDFINTMKLIVDMLNPVTNPRIGCAECHEKAAGMLNDLVHRPPPDAATARIWLVKKHNIVNARLGKPELDMSEAADANLWT